MAFNTINDKELINAYALCKQIDETFTNLKLNDELLRSMSKKIGIANQMDAMLITKVLDQKGLNPRNTKDSVANEILVNIKEITNLKLEKNANLKGMMACVNRLIHYKIANLENLLILPGKVKINFDLDACLERNKDVHKSIKNSLSPIN